MSSEKHFEEGITPKIILDKVNPHPMFVVPVHDNYYNTPLYQSSLISRAHDLIPKLRCFHEIPAPLAPKCFVQMKHTTTENFDMDQFEETLRIALAKVPDIFSNKDLQRS